MTMGISWAIAGALSNSATVHVPAAGGSYGAEATALFARFSTDPGSTRKSAIDTCIASLKSAGVWAKLEGLWVFAAHEEASALLNWVSTSHNMAKVSSPTFTTDQGFTGDSSNHLSPGDNISTYTLFTQNSAHLSVWTRGTGTNGEASVEIGGSSIYPRYIDDNVYVRVNDFSPSSNIASVATAAGFIVGNRSGSTDREAYKNGVSLGTYGAVLSAAPSSVPNWGKGQQISAASIGSSLNSTEQLDFYNAMNTLKTAIGW